MPLDADYLRRYRFPLLEAEITDRDVMLYALTVGLGRDPLNEHELRYVYEQDLRVFPTMPVVVGHPGNWMVDRRTGITRTMVVHGSQRLTCHRPLPIGGAVTIRNRITALLDKGDRGAVIVTTRDVCDKASGDLVCAMESQVFCRADGGFGGSGDGGYEFRALPDRAPDRTVDVPTEPNAALLYRLNQDRNPLHADPAVARRAGFDRPILHGLATFGAAAVAVSRGYPERTITAFECRFSKPVFPGETISVDMWDNDGGEIAFRARIAARDAVVLDRGLARLAAA